MKANKLMKEVNRNADAVFYKLADGGPIQYYEFRKSDWPG